MIPESFSAIPALSIGEKLLLFAEVAAVLAILAVILYYFLRRGSEGGDPEDEQVRDGREGRPHG